MRDVLEFEVPLPPAEASPNLRASRLARMRALAGYRWLVGALARQALERSSWPIAPRVCLSLTYRLAGGRDGFYRPNDPDNALAAAKPLIDGLSDAGLIEDDSWRWLEIGRIAADPDGGPGVLIRAEVLE